MWVRKDEMELERDARRRARARYGLKVPLAVAFVGFLLSLILSVTGSPRFFRSPSPIIDGLWGGTIVGAVMGAGTWALRVVAWDSMFSGGRSRTLLCASCFEASDDPPESACGCGGRREPLDAWEWHEEPADTA